MILKGIIYSALGLSISLNSFALSVDSETDLKKDEAATEDKFLVNKENAEEKLLGADGKKIQNKLSANIRKDEKNPRTPQFENDQLEVWNTKIFPDQPLKMHRHDKKRILVGITDVDLKATNEKGETHSIRLKKGEAKLLEADKPGELHNDVNETNHPMELIVIQFK